MKHVCIGLLGLSLILSSPDLSAAQQQQTSRSMSGEVFYGVASPVLSVVYFPIKFSVGVVGAILGGISGGLTGGSERAAKGIWWPTAGGSYFITPDVLSGEEPFRPLDGGPQRVSSSGFGHLRTYP
jgi:hypothetical protein